VAKAAQLVSEGKAGVNLAEEDGLTIWLVKVRVGEGNANANAVDKEGLTPLWKASKNGHSEA